jgi:hypothetical protein
MSVRNCLLALALASAVAAPVAPAAAAPPGQLEGGVRGGLVLSALSGAAIDDSATRTSTKGGPTGALLLRWLHGPWAVEGELGVSDRGAAVEPPRAEAVAHHLYYADLPLTGVYTLDLGLPVAFRLAAGLQFSLLIDQTAGDLAPAAIEERFDVALVLGAGVAWPLAGGTALVDLRFLGGARQLSSVEVRGQAVSLTAGYAF